MPATVFPAPVSVNQILLNFVGLTDLLAAMEVQTGLTKEQILLDYAVAAQGDLERLSGVPFFKTRYCTRELASQDSLVLGTDFDRYVRPEDYDWNQWAANTGALQLPWAPLASIEKLTFSTVNGGELLEMPAAWINRDDWHGILHFYPPATGGVTLLFKLASLLPIYRSGMASGNIPLLIHPRFSAGLVNLPSPMSNYDPNTAVENTDWDAGLVSNYQAYIAADAAADVMEKIATELTLGGASIAFDGLSEAVNPQVLIQKVESLRQQSAHWAQNLRQQIRGIAVAFA